MNGARVLEPEWLDELPPADPRARRSRRDLVRVNALMGHAGIVRGELARVGAIRSIAEIGAGDGSFLLRALRGLSPEAGASAVLLDRHRLASADTLRSIESLGWHVRAVSADVLEWLSDPATPVFDVMVANLFLHHFDSHALGRLLALAARHARVFVACEPRRGRVALAGAKLLGLVGCGPVTRHDAVVSVHAGFSGKELGALWPSNGPWICDERARGLFSHGFVARRP